MRKRTISLCAAAMLLIPAALAEDGGQTAIDLTGLWNAIIALLGALVTSRLIPWIKARTTREQQDLLSAGIRTAVYAAEQLYKTGEVQDRLEYALKWLGEHGYSADRAQVEAAVREMQSNIVELEETISTTEVTEDGDN